MLMGRWLSLFIIQFAKKDAVAVRLGRPAFTAKKDDLESIT